jgi:hypothetical protein
VIKKRRINAKPHASYHSSSNYSYELSMVLWSRSIIWSMLLSIYTELNFHTWYCCLTCFIDGNSNIF